MPDDGSSNKNGSFGWPAIGFTAFMTASVVCGIVLFIWPSNTQKTPSDAVTNEFLLSSNGFFAVGVHGEFTDVYKMQLTYIDENGNRELIKDYGRASRPLNKPVTEVRIGGFIEGGDNVHTLILYAIENKRRGGYGTREVIPEPIALEKLNYGRLHLLQKDLADGPIPLTTDPIPVIYFHTPEDSRRYVIELVRYADQDPQE